MPDTALCNILTAGVFSLLDLNLSCGRQPTTKRNLYENPSSHPEYLLISKYMTPTPIYT